MTTCAIAEPDEVASNSTHEFRLDATYDGSPWDLTGATVSIIFRSPAGTETTKSATITDAAAGLAHYVAATTDLVPAARRERWTRCWRIQQSPLDERSLPVPFILVKSP